METCMTRHFFDASILRVTFKFENNKISVFRYGVGECVYQFESPYRSLFGQEVPYKPTKTHLQVKMGITSIGRPYVNFDNLIA